MLIKGDLALKELMTITLGINFPTTGSTAITVIGINLSLIGY